MTMKTRHKKKTTRGRNQGSTTIITIPIRSSNRNDMFGTKYRNANAENNTATENITKSTMACFRNDSRLSSSGTVIDLNDLQKNISKCLFVQYAVLFDRNKVRAQHFALVDNFARAIAPLEKCGNCH